MFTAKFQRASHPGDVGTFAQTFVILEPEHLENHPITVFIIFAKNYMHDA